MTSARVRGADGKWYLRRSLTTSDREYLVGRCHYLSHDEHLSIRQMIARIAAENELALSVGTVSHYLRGWQCDHQQCSGGANEAPEQETSA